MLTALVLIIVATMGSLGLHFHGLVSKLAADPHSRIFVFDDWAGRQNFWKQFLSGIFIVIVMTGLDQDMMQKNMTCKTLREAQKDMCLYGFAFVPVNLLFLVLGILLTWLAAARGIALPEMGDDLLPMFAASGQLGATVVILFTIGIVASSFSSADSALTALTTSVCVDLFERSADERLRKRVHLTIAVLFVVFILIFLGCQLHECHRCYLYSLWVYLWTVVGPLCLRTANAPPGQRPQGAVGRHRQSPALFCYRLHDAAAHGLSVRLRAAHAQWCPYFCWIVDASAKDDCAEQKVT